VRTLVRSFIVSAALAAVLSPVLMQVQSISAFVQSPSPSPTYSPTPTPTATPAPSPSPSPTPTPTPTGEDSSGGSINDLAKQRFNQMITNRVLGSVLLGVNEQVNCSDCVGAFGSAGSVSAGIHGRKELTPNLSLLAGIAYIQYSEGGYNVTSAPIGAFALRYDFADWGSSRPFFDIGAILSPFEKVRHTRSYMTSLGPVSVEGRTSSATYGVYGRAGWISRLSPRDEVAASVEVWQLWQRVKGYSDPVAAFNPDAADGTDRTNLVKVGGQWTHLFGTSVEANINGGFVQSIVAAVTGDGTIVPMIGTRAGSNMAAGSASGLQKAGSPISSSMAPPARSRSATPCTAAWD
jgi:hypothetical protein